MVQQDDELKRQVDEDPLANLYLTAWTEGQQDREQCSNTYEQCLMTTAEIDRALQWQTPSADWIILQTIYLLNF